MIMMFDPRDPEFHGRGDGSVSEERLLDDRGLIWKIDDGGLTMEE
jgi:hypothetical protein